MKYFTIIISTCTLVSAQEYNYYDEYGAPVVEMKAAGGKFEFFD